MADEVARLVAVMEAQLKGFSKGMDQAQQIADRRFGQIEKRMKQTEQTFESGFKGLTALAGAFGVALSAGAVIEFAKRVFEMGSQLQDAAVIAGTGVEALQAYRNALIDNGGAADIADRALAKINDKMGEAARGSKEAQAAFKAFNIDASNIPPDAAGAFALIAQKTLEMGSAAEQTAALDNLLGDRLGRFLLPALNDVAQGTDALTAKYKEQGRIIDEELTKKMKAAGDEMAKSWGQVEVAIAPAVSAIGQFIAAVIRLGIEWRHTKEERDAFLNRDVPKAGSAVAQLPFANPETLGIMTPAPPKKTTWLPPPEDVKKAEEEAQRIAKMFNESNNEFIKNFKPKGIGLSPEQLFGAAQAGHLSGLEQESGRRVTAEQIKEITAELQRQLDIAGKLPQEQERLNELHQIDLETNGELTAAEKDRLSDLIKQRQDASEALQNNIEEADALRDAFSSTGAVMFQSFHSLGDVAHQFLQQIIAMIVQFEIMKPLVEDLFGKHGTTLGGSLGGGGGILGLIGGIGSLLGFAGGGDPPVGRASIVGERGPELFVPRVTGTIIPNGAGMGGQIQVVLSVQPSGEFNARVAGVSRQTAAEVVVQYDRGMPQRWHQIASDPYRR